ncbi:unnamed protein product [Diamesa hyperborea]
MSAKVIVLFAFVAVASAGILQGGYYPQQTLVKTIQPTIVKQVVHAAQEAPANYEFNYAVNEASTGDVHSQQEKAVNGAIQGSYQMNDADGFLRTVDYTADDVNGFQATVRREPLQHVKVIQPVTKIIKKIIAQPQAGPWY